jgi:hypothetical protein
MAMGQYFTEIALVAQRWDEQRVVISLERHGRFLPVMGAWIGRSAVVRTVLRRCLLHLPIFNTEKTKNHEGIRGCQADRLIWHRPTISGASREAQYRLSP